MKLAPALGFLALGLALTTGCSSQKPQPQQPSDVIAKMNKELATAQPSSDPLARMDAELANAIGTTTLTSEDIELPSERLSVAQWDEEEEAQPVAVQTWGVSKEDPGARP